MKIAFVSHIEPPQKIKNFYWSGWRTAFAGHEVQYLPHGKASLEFADGKFDLCVVAPGFFKMSLDCYKSKSKTKYVFVSDEDLHAAVEHLRCAADYYDHVFLTSEVNVEALHRLGAHNVSQILSCVDTEVYTCNEIQQPFQVSFLGNSDTDFLIQGSTRRQYLTEIDAFFKARALIGHGFFAGAANDVYNRSVLSLDLPIATAIGPRAFQIGASQSVLLIPENPRYSKLWFKNFSAGHHYLEFSGGISGLIDVASKADPDELKKISASMRETLKQHTFEKRFNQMLEVIF